MRKSVVMQHKTADSLVQGQVADPGPASVPSSGFSPEVHLFMFLSFQ